MIEGIVLVNKPSGLTSNAVLQRVKRLYGAKKAGHTGSLDPLATGMLPICLGEATKISQYVLDADKCYTVTALLGVTTDTGDALGQILTHASAENCTLDDLLAILPQFRGVIQQIPPMYSALKRQGRPLYHYARQGIVLEREAREVSIYEMTLQSFQDDKFSLLVRCSKGTYIRSLIESIGESLGVGAHVTALHRCYTAGFEQEEMYTLEQLEQATMTQRLQFLLPVARGVAQFPVVYLTDLMVESLQQGKTIENFSLEIQGLVVLHQENDTFFGMGEISSEGRLAAKRLISNVSSQL